MATTTEAMREETDPALSIALERRGRAEEEEGRMRRGWWWSGNKMERDSAGEGERTFRRRNSEIGSGGYYHMWQYLGFRFSGR